MKLENLSVEDLDHLIRDVFLPVSNIAAQLDSDRQLALATLQALGANPQTTAQHERILSAQVGRSVMPHYVRLREHYAQNRQEIEAWISVRRGDLEDALNACIEAGNAGLLYQDPDVIRDFVLACEHQLTGLSARFRELTY
jgi:hypothetical protein